MLEALFDDIIAEEMDESKESVGGADNMSAILIEFNANNGNA